MNKYILTGGPCAGKTTMIDLLAEQGYATSYEAAREVITREQQKEDGALPWVSMDHYIKFHDLLVDEQLKLEQALGTQGDSFLDRSLIDIIGYSAMMQAPLPENLYQHIEEAGYSKVFFLEVLPESYYKNDEARTETYEQALKTQASLLEAYRQSGLEVVMLENSLGVEGRMEKILSSL